MTPNIAERVEWIKTELEGWSKEHYLDRDDSWIKPDIEFLLDLIGKYQRLVNAVNEGISVLPEDVSPRYEWEMVKKESGLFDQPDAQANQVAPK